jgi:hypothetical protein
LRSFTVAKHLGSVALQFQIQRQPFGNGGVVFDDGYERAWRRLIHAAAFRRGRMIRKRAPLAFLRLDVNLAMVGLDDGAHDGEPKPRALGYRPVWPPTHD